MKTISVNVYQFDELGDKAKEVARSWFKRDDYPGEDWWEGVYDDSKETAKFFGIEIDKISFSGFSCQGDGASFTGTFRGGNLKTLEKLKENCPKEEGLHRLMTRLQAVKHPEDSKLDITVMGYYSHSGTMDVSDPDYVYESSGLKIIEQGMKYFADWIYRNLGECYEWLLSNESVDENIICNGYWFLVDGSRCTLGDD